MPLCYIAHGLPSYSSMYTVIINLYRHAYTLQKAILIERLILQLYNDAYMHKWQCMFFKSESL